MLNKYKDKTTGRIGRKRYAELERMIEEGLTSAEIGQRLQVNQETVRKYARKRGLTIRCGIPSGEDHPGWKTGMVKDRSGYVLARTPVDSEFGYLIRALQPGRKHGYAPIHRIEMHKKLGRRLEPGEVVDHIDGNVSNNDPSNLRVFASNAKHLGKTLAGRTPNWTPEGRARIGDALQSVNGKRPKFF